MNKKKLFWYIVIVEIVVELLLLGLVYGVSRYKKENVGAINIDNSSDNNTSINNKSNTNKDNKNNTSSNDTNQDKSFIKWVDFKVSSEALKEACFYDVESYYGRIISNNKDSLATENNINENETMGDQKDKELADKLKKNKIIKINWIDLLAYLACEYGGDFKKYKKIHMEELVERLKNGENIDEITKDKKYYGYYREAYEAVLGGMVGKYTLGGEEKYGLKAFFPIAKNFPYSHYDDFGVSREYGYKRRHLGHDMMGQVGTPVTNVESGYVEAIGWNQYGGWRLGIRSFDKKRYYYYAHLRKNFPYNKSLKEGSIVTAGDVIGYMGRTGYSRNENVNNINTSHLHFGIQLIFDESQKEGNGEIWIDCYQIVKFLYSNRSETVKNIETKEYSRVIDMVDPSVDKYIKKRRS